MTARADTTSLDDVLAYRHPGVIRRYVKEHGASPAEAEEVYREMLKWLYLSYRSAIDPEGSAGCVMTVEIEKLDHMWHIFLLFTQDYAAFCEHYFGFFLHHVPQDDDEDEQPVSTEVVRRQLERQYGLVYDVLGEQTLLSWYDECRYAVA
jgi:hypothetical protein